MELEGTLWWLTDLLQGGFAPREARITQECFDSIQSCFCRGLLISPHFKDDEWSPTAHPRDTAPRPLDEHAASMRRGHVEIYCLRPPRRPPKAVNSLYFRFLEERTSRLEPSMAAAGSGGG
ncbi:hypothetical protein MPTK1_4g08570 [Marchantia polymorpha subsp. ruderalis]|uniref:Uncharacterized protein n=2 Tax=Marchantia polymorpha TaxID=3197 RepID=A0AAF6B7T2_MARPO|nr:hypothetical protein MARPO_0122s0008 [Marchantia polymorpha]BBN08066.1 hypothetical protein Mp_4g08570 [Marchantia polymorpha subsp. ruderalis]|eukprot:PTQ30573.1 hypothetical protein MARPO_0122s0008 [Marchantia polymorpha]